MKMPHHTLHMSQHVYRDVVLLCLVTLGDLPFEIISDIRSNSITWGGSQCITNKIFPHQALKMLKMAFSRSSKLHLHSPSNFLTKLKYFGDPTKYHDNNLNLNTTVLEIHISHHHNTMSFS